MPDLKRTELSVRAERAILVQVYHNQEHALASAAMDELRNLAVNARATVVGYLTQARPKPDPRSYLGKG